MNGFLLSAMRGDSSGQTPRNHHNEPGQQMTYNEALDAEVTREEARREIAKYDVPGGFELFLQEVGDKAEYLGREVLDWLGH